MKFAYLDESGTSTEPVRVVASVIVDGDRQYCIVRNHLRALLDDFFDGEVPERTFIHAKDIWAGNKAFDKKKYSLVSRLRLLADVANIPQKFRLPLAFGFVRKGHYNHTSVRERDRPNMDHALAFFFSVVGVERFMRELGRPNEVATLVAEDVTSARSHLKGAFDLAGSPIASRIGVAGIAPYLPISRIVDTAHFTAKGDAPLLQIADVSAFLIRSTLSGNTKSADIVKVLLAGNDLDMDILSRSAGYQIVQWAEDFISSGTFRARY